uniref:LysB n=1 Tax=Lactococcus phage mv4 TaxID=12392 RepID=Q38372_BPMV4|nr:LysB [Lactobacillus phage mv4]
MSLTDWLNLIVAIGTIALAVVASLYLRYKTKIDTKTAAGKVFDVIGKLAVWAVNEAEHSDLRAMQSGNMPQKSLLNNSNAKELPALPSQRFTGQFKPLGRPQTSTMGKSPQRARTRFLAIQQTA